MSTTDFVKDRILDFADGARRQRPEKTAAELRARYFELALNRGSRDEPVEITLARAETIRRYIEEGTVSPEPC